MQKYGQAKKEKLQEYNQRFKDTHPDHKERLQGYLKQHRAENRLAILDQRKK